MVGGCYPTVNYVLIALLFSAGTATVMGEWWSWEICAGMAGAWSKTIQFGTPAAIAIR